MPVRHTAAALFFLAFCVLPIQARSQAAPAGDSAQAEPVANTSPSRASEVPDVPGLSSVLHGLNAGVTFAGVHDAYTGWATLVTPAIGFSFNHVFTADVSVPIYFFRLSPSTLARPRPNELLIQERGEVADVVIAGHAQFVPRNFNYQATAALAVPTGDAQNGLTTGRVSFDFDNHFDKTVFRVTPNLDIGIGDTASLVNRITTKNYTSLGPLAHFQVGLGFPLPFHTSFVAEAYEQLPIGDQKTYGPSRNGRSTVVTGRNITEDNGFITSIDVPLSGHTTLSAYYNRSLRFYADNVSIGFTYVLRGSPEPSYADIDLLLREPPTASPPQPGP